jgi:hypothetical protein
MVSPKLVLLLGSFDNDTRRLLDLVKARLVETFRKDDVYVYLLDTLLAYKADSYQVLVEHWSDESATLFVFSPASDLQVVDLSVEGSLPDAVEKYMKQEYQVSTFSETDVLEKLSIIYSACLSTMLIRLREETRGGELVELTYLALTYKGNKIWFLKKDGIEISTMVKELLDALQLNFRSFKTDGDLIDESRRIVRYSLERGI